MGCRQKSGPAFGINEMSQVPLDVCWLCHREIPASTQYFDNLYDRGPAHISCGERYEAWIGKCQKCNPDRPRVPDAEFEVVVQVTRNRFYTNLFSDPSKTRLCKRHTIEMFEQSLFDFKLRAGNRVCSFQVTPIVLLKPPDMNP